MCRTVTTLDVSRNDVIFRFYASPVHELRASVTSSVEAVLINRNGISKLVTSESTRIDFVAYFWVNNIQIFIF